jgi:hypothetical protein
MIDYYYAIVNSPGRYYLIREMDQNIHVINFDSIYLNHIKILSFLNKYESDDKEEELIEDYSLNKF